MERDRGDSADPSALGRHVVGLIGQLLQGPAGPVRIAEGGVQDPPEILDLADIHPAVGERRTRRVDVRGASSSVTSADPPAAVMSAETASSEAWVRPARKTRAPSRAKVRATPPPIPRPVDQGVLGLKKQFHPPLLLAGR
jgi:hypothetical protein